MRMWKKTTWIWRVGQVVVKGREMWRCWGFKLTELSLLRSIMNHNRDGKVDCSWGGSRLLSFNDATWTLAYRIVFPRNGEYQILAPISGNLQEINWCKISRSLKVLLCQQVNISSNTIRGHFGLWLPNLHPQPPWSSPLISPPPFPYPCPHPPPLASCQLVRKTDTSLYRKVVVFTPIVPTCMPLLIYGTAFLCPCLL